MADRKYMKRRLAVALAVLATAGGAGGFYALRSYRIAQHIEGLRPAGLAELEEGKSREAMFKLGAYLQHHPDDVEALRAYARARLETPEADGSHVGQTVGILRRVLELDRGDAAAAHQLMELYVRIGFYTEAAELAEKALAKAENDAAALRVLAEAYRGTREFPKAYAAADKLTALEPNNLQAQMLALTLLHEQGKPASELLARVAAAQATIGDHPHTEILAGFAHQLAGKLDRATQHYGAAAKRVTDDAAAIEVLASLLDQVGQPTQAIELLTGADGSVSNPQIRSMLLRRLWEQGRLDLVLEHGRAISADDPRTPARTLVTLALARLQLNQKAEAEPLVAALEARPRDAEAQAWAPVLRAMGDTGGEADARLRLAVESGVAKLPREAHLYFLLGESQRRGGDNEATIQSWRQAAALAPSWPAPQLAMTRLLLATDRPLLAFEVARAAAQRFPKHPEAVITMLECIGANIERLGEAELDQVRLMVRQTNDALGRQSRLLALEAELVARAGETDEAKALVAGALQQQPALPPHLLMQLAGVSGRHGLGLEDSCIAAAAASAGGREPSIAVAQAALQAKQSGVDQAIAAFEAGIPQALSEAEARQWAIAKARLIEGLKPAAAIAAWTEALARFSQDPVVLQAALESDAVWQDRKTASDAVRRLREAAGENSLAWRIARARQIITAAPGERGLAEASTLLLEATRQAPLLVQPHVLLGATLERLGNTSAALASYETAQRLAPESADIALSRARAMAAAGNGAGSTQLLDAIAGRKNLSPPQRRQVGAALASQGKVDHAEQILRELVDAGSADRQARLLLATILARRGDVARAEQLLREALAEPDVTTIEVAAHFFDETGRPQDADAALSKLDALQLEDGAKALVRANAAQRRNDLVEAVRQLEAVAGSATAGAEVHRQLVSCHLKLGDVNAAIAAAERGLRSGADGPGIRSVVEQRALLARVAQDSPLRPLTLGLLEDDDRRGAAVEAITLVLDGEKNGRPASEVAVALRRLCDRHPRYLPLHVLTIQVYRGIKRDDEAAELATRAMRAMPEAAEPAWLASEALASAGRWSEALSVAEEWRRRAARAPLAADLMIAEAQLALGKADAAAAQMQGYADGTAGPLAVRMQARALLAAGKLEEAEALVSPRLSEGRTWRFLGIQLAVLVVPDLPSATRWIEAVAAASPADDADEQVAIAQAWRALDERFGDSTASARSIEILGQLTAREDGPAAAHESLAMIADAEGRTDAAVDGYRRTLAIDPKRPLAQNNLAMILHTRRQDAEALPLAMRAVESAPRVAAFRDTLALTLVASGRGKEAVEHARLAVMMQPNNVELYLTLGEALIAAEDTKAVGELMQWLDQNLQPPDRLAEPIRRRIEELRRRALAATQASATHP